MCGGKMRQPVYGVKRIYRGLGRAIRRCGPRYISGCKLQRIVFIAQFRDEAFPIEIDRNDAVSVRKQPPGTGTADTARRAGNDDGFIFNDGSLHPILTTIASMF